jgi:TRAP-type mannitol/chloroaromatic compound transport system permease large subunit
MSVEFLTVAMFVSLIVAIIFGHPLAYTLAAVATLFGLIDNGFNFSALFDMFANNAWGIMENYVLVAIPLFILMAQLLDRSKVSDKLFEALYVVLGSIKGGWAWPSSWCAPSLPPQRASSAPPWWPWACWPRRPCCARTIRKR